MAANKGKRSTAASSKPRGKRKNSKTERKRSPEAPVSVQVKGETERTPTAADIEALRSAPPTMPPGETMASFRPFEAMMRTATAFAGIAMGSAMGLMIGATRGAIEGGLAGMERSEQQRS